MATQMKSFDPENSTEDSYQDQDLVITREKTLVESACVKWPVRAVALGGASTSMAGVALFYRETIVTLYFLGGAFQSLNLLTGFNTLLQKLPQPEFVDEKKSYLKVWLGSMGLPVLLGASGVAAHFAKPYSKDADALLSGFYLITSYIASRVHFYEENAGEIPRAALLDEVLGDVMRLLSSITFATHLNIGFTAALLGNSFLAQTASQNIRFAEKEALDTEHASYFSKIGFFKPGLQAIPPIVSTCMTVVLVADAVMDEAFITPAIKFGVGAGILASNIIYALASTSLQKDVSENSGEGFFARLSTNLLPSFN